MTHSSRLASALSCGWSLGLRLVCWFIVMGLVDVIMRPMGAGMTPGQIGEGVLMGMIGGAVGGMSYGALTGAGPTPASRRLGAGAVAGVLTGALAIAALFFLRPTMRARGPALALALLGGATVAGMVWALVAPRYAQVLRQREIGWRR